MNDYSVLSDFEINKIVAISMGLMVQDIDDSKITGMTSSYHQQRPHTCWVTNGEEPWVQYAPCNAAEDAWPIVLEHKINIDHRASIRAGAMAKLSGNNEVYAVNDNALRAAMEVYLMAMDAGLLKD